MGAKRVVILGIVLIALIILTSICSITFGTIKISFNDVKNYAFKGTTGNAIKDKIIEKLRILRIFGAIIAGMAISIAGVLMQGYFRNPLAEPYLTGVASGASLGVVLYAFTSLLTGYNLGIWGKIISANIRAFITLFIIINIAKVVKQTSTLLICGMMIGAIVSGFNSIIIYTSDYLGIENDKLGSYFTWIMGCVSQLTTDEIKVMAIITLPIVVLAIIFLSKNLDANLLGENYAISVGVNIKRLKQTLLILSGILTACVVSFTGPIAFLGLMCPIIARMLCNTSKHIYVMPITALLGMLLLLISDICVRPGVVIPVTSNELPLSCPLSIIGAPIAVIIYLKMRRLGI